MFEVVFCSDQIEKDYSLNHVLDPLTCVEFTVRADPYTCVNDQLS